VTAATLWTATKARKDAYAILSLTNPRDTSAVTPNDSVGEQAAADVLGFWSIYAQEDFDESNEAHLVAAVEGVVAQLWRRNAPTSEAADRAWKLVFGDDGMVAKIRSTGPRSAQGPVIARRRDEVSRDGYALRSFGDRRNVPAGVLPKRRREDD